VIATTAPTKIVGALSPELVKPEFRGEHPLSGHCYVASEAFYHLVGGKPMNVRHEGVSHWFILLDDEVVDLTAAQFDTPVDYSKARGCGFLTKQPSKRCQVVLDRIACM
jgi:hypothetical protein